CPLAPRASPRFVTTTRQSVPELRIRTLALVVRPLVASPLTSESQVLRFSGSQVLRFSGSQVLRFSGSQVLRFSGSQVLRFSGSHVPFNRLMASSGHLSCRTPLRP